MGTALSADWKRPCAQIQDNEVVLAIESGRISTVLEHPNRSRYQGQRLYVIEIEDYAYVVPFVERKGARFLKTIFPSRKYTRMYLRTEGDHQNEDE